MPEIKVLMVMTDDVNEPTLREFLRLGGYKFSTTYLQPEDEAPPIPTESQDIPPQPIPAHEIPLGATPKEAERTSWWSFCTECGPNVKVDEDGCCISCGFDAIGPAVIEEGVKRYALEKVNDAAKEAMKYADVIGRCPERSVAFNNLEAAIAEVKG